jgi:hypothetical protein
MNFNSDWKKDILDDKSKAHNFTPQEQASRKTLLRNNKHIYDNKSHYKSTTLKRGFIGEIVARDFFKDYSEKYKVPEIISINENALSFEEEFVKSLTAFHFQLLLQEIKKNNPELWELKAKKVYCELMEHIISQQKVFDNDEEELRKCLYNFIKEFEKREKVSIPHTPYYDQAIETLGRALENFLESKDVEFFVNVAKDEIKTHTKFLDSKAISLYRDPNPLNILVPNKSEDHPNGLPVEVNRKGKKSEVINSLEKWLYKINDQGINCFVKSIVNIDFELIGVKLTSPFDHYVHIIGLCPTTEIREDLKANLIKGLDQDQEIEFHLMWAFRLMREGTRRMKYVIDSVDQKDDYNKRYGLWNIWDDFTYYFTSGIESYNRVEEKTDMRFPVMKYCLAKIADYWKNHQLNYYQKNNEIKRKVSIFNGGNFRFGAGALQGVN